VLYNYDRVADTYDATRGIPPGAHETVTDGLISALREVAPDPRVLEVGVGTGRIAVPLAEMGIRLTGIDISRRMLSRLHRRNQGVAAVLAEAARLPFREGSFDAVLFVHILHLVPDPEATLRAAAAALRPAGALLLGQTTFSPSPVHEIRPLLDRTVEEVTGRPLATPRRFVDTEQYTTLLPGMGFEVTGARVLATWRDASTGRDTLADVAERRNSNTWNIPEAATPAILALLAPRLEALLGGLDRVYESEARFELRVARRSAQPPH